MSNEQDEVNKATDQKDTVGEHHTKAHLDSAQAQTSQDNNEVSTQEAISSDKGEQKDEQAQVKAEEPKADEAKGEEAKVAEDKADEGEADEAAQAKAADAQATESGDSSKPKKIEIPEGVTFKMGDDVSAYTGRPRISKEENEALKEGSRFFHKAMESSARARGEEYHPYRIPAQMRAALTKIDIEKAQDEINAKIAEARAAGMPLSDDEIAKLEKEAVMGMHRIDSDEVEEMRHLSEEEARIANGGARFINKYHALINKQNEHRETNKQRAVRNLKILFIVAVGLIGYVGYNNYFVDQNAKTISELKGQLPLKIDATTTMVRIDDRNNDFKIYFEKDPKAYDGLTADQKDAMLNSFTHNAPLLCKNPLLHDIIASGKKVTVLLEASDRSFYRELVVDKCPTADNANGKQ